LVLFLFLYIRSSIIVEKLAVRMATSPRSPLSPLTNMSQGSPANVQAEGVDCGVANSSGDMSIEETVTIINELNTLLSKDDGTAICLRNSIRNCTFCLSLRLR
jgi:hypothetical protein